MKTAVWFLLTGLSGIAMAEQNPAMVRQSDAGYSRLADAVNQLATAQGLADQGAAADALAPAVVRHLASPNADVRAWAEMTLIEMGPKCRPAVSRALKSGRPAVREAARRILSGVEEQALIRMAADVPSFKVR